MSQITNISNGTSPIAPVVQLTPNNGNTVTADAMQNIDVFGGQGANGAINIQTDGNPIGAIPLHELDIRLTDSILLPATNASGSQGIIGLGSTDYVTDRFMHNFGTRNTWLGYQNGPMTFSISSENVGVGYQVMTNATLGGGTGISANVGVGYSALNGAASAASGGVASCVAIGWRAMLFSGGPSANYSSFGNTVIGSNAGLSVGGVGNVLIGHQAGVQLRQGTGNTIINTGAGSATLYTGLESYNILISNSGVLGENYTTRIGRQRSGTTGQDRCFIAGIVGVTTSNSQLVTIDSTTGQLGVTDLQPFPWSTITMDMSAAVNQGYFVNKAGTLILTLPATSAVGDVIEVANINTATGTQITCGGGQQIFIGNTSTSVGGTLTSIAVGDTIKLVCRTANTEWQALYYSNWTPA